MNVFKCLNTISLSGNISGWYKKRRHAKNRPLLQHFLGRVYGPALHEDRQGWVRHDRLHPY